MSGCAPVLGCDTLGYNLGICHALAIILMANELDAWFGIYCGVIGLVVCAYMFFFSSITDRKVLFFKEPKQVRDLLLAIVIVGPVLVVILNIVFVYQSTYKLHGKSIKGLLGMQIGFYLLQTLYVFIVARSKKNKKLQLRVTLGVCALLQFISLLLSAVESTCATNNYIFAWNIFPVLWTYGFDFCLYTFTEEPYSFARTTSPVASGFELELLL